MNYIYVFILNPFRLPWTWWAIFKLPYILRKQSPDIIQTWLYHADFIGGLASLFCKASLVWNIRQTDISFKNNKIEIFLVARLTKILSKMLPQKIICCSDSVKASHIKIGYNRERMVVVPNGCDTSQYKYNSERRKQKRKALGLTGDEILICRVGRFDPQKDYQTFISAMAIVQTSHQNVRFLLVGENIDSANTDLMRWIKQTPNAEKYLLLGKRDDLHDLYQAIDIMVSSSLGEGFPNVIAEAMSTEVPCIATDVGESKKLVGDTGIIVPSRDKKKLADACLKLIDSGKLERQALGASARSRIINMYSLNKSADEYRSIYDHL